MSPLCLKRNRNNVNVTKSAISKDSPSSSSFSFSFLKAATPKETNNKTTGTGFNFFILFWTCSEELSRNICHLYHDQDFIHYSWNASLSHGIWKVIQRKWTPYKPTIFKNTICNSYHIKPSWELNYKHRFHSQIMTRVNFSVCLKRNGNKTQRGKKKAGS